MFFSQSCFYLSGQVGFQISGSPSFALSGVFLLALGVPILVVVFGSYYCGHICSRRCLITIIIPDWRCPRPSTCFIRVTRIPVVGLGTIQAVAPRVTVVWVVLGSTGGIFPFRLGWQTVTLFATFIRKGVSVTSSRPSKNKFRFVKYNITVKGRIC